MMHDTLEELLDFDPSDPACTACGMPPSLTDVFDNMWCQVHAYRTSISAWGKQHNYPYLQCFPYAVGGDEFCWRVSMIGSEDFMRKVYATIQRKESEVA